MNVEFLEEAEAELVDAACWYESIKPGLGRRFKRDVEAVVASIVENPLQFRECDGKYRRANCPVFPYFLPYFIRGDKVVVAAVAHQHRRPGYWHDRSSGS